MERVGRQAVLRKDIWRMSERGWEREDGNINMKTLHHRDLGKRAAMQRWSFMVLHNMLSYDDKWEFGVTVTLLAPIIQVVEPSEQRRIISQKEREGSKETEQLTITRQLSTIINFVWIWK